MAKLVAMSLATQDDLSRYLDSAVRVVSVDDGGEPPTELGELLGGSILTVRHPTDAEGIDEWRQLIVDLEPRVLVVSHDTRLVERAGFPTMGPLQVLMRTDGLSLGYRWARIGNLITLVVSGSETDALRVLSALELRKLATLVRGLLPTS